MVSIEYRPVREEFDNEHTQGMVIAYLSDLIDYCQTTSSYKHISTLEKTLEVVEGFKYADN